MHKTKLLASVSMMIAMAGCATAPPAYEPSEEAEILSKIATHAHIAIDAQTRLATMKNGGSSYPNDPTSDDGIDAPISINWTGPIDKLAEKVAEMTGYQYAGTVGSKPPMPVIVTISALGSKGSDVLLDANFQAGSAAEIKVSKETNKITVQFPPTTKSGGYPVMK